MTSFEKLLPEDQAALETAAVWWDRLRAEPAQELSSEFMQWTSEARNMKALNAVRDTMADLNRFGAAPAILDMRRAALTRLRHANSRWWSKMQTLARIAAALVICAVVAGSYLWYRVNSPVSYVTQVGERYLVVLPDGSRASLDSNTAIQVQYGREWRRIRLDHGQARFDVAHDTARPFIVSASGESVTAVGTMFNVEKLGSKTLVTLLQGRVIVKEDAEGDRAHAPILLVAGQQMTAIDGHVPVVQQANLEDARAWESGHLIFRNEPLGDAVERVNRYTSNPITVAPAAASIPVSGVFNAGDTGSFISAITGYFPVEVTTDTENRIRFQRRS